MVGHDDTGALTRMTARAEAISGLLESVDAVLAPLGFARRPRAQEWQKRADPSSVAWVHLNVGKGIVNPSVGVRYGELTDLLPKAVAPVDSTTRMLGPLWSPAHTYSLSASPAPLLEDLRGQGIGELTRLLDRHAVIEMLNAPSPAAWPVPGLSWRIRLLPLLLATDGRVAEALEVAERFRGEAIGRDQLVPRYEVFLDAFRSRFAAPVTD